MKQFSYVLTNQDALQTRPMGSLMREAARFSSRVRAEQRRKIGAALGASRRSWVLI